MVFVGRTQELERLEEAYQSKESRLAVIYGRRRVGKSRLIAEFSKSKSLLSFEGLEGERTPVQIAHFTRSLGKQLNEPFLEKTHFEKWEEVFDYLTRSRKRLPGKLVLFLDELQWMAVGQEKLVSLIKYYWDNYWKSENIFLILCGSIAPFMVNRVIHSKALYGRVHIELLLRALPPGDAKLFFRSKRSNEEILKYLLVFGGIPRYLEAIDLNQSFEKNMNRLCFRPGAEMVDEVKRIFYSHFREPRIYLKIVNELKNGLRTLDELAQTLKMNSGGGLKRYVDNLVDSEFIQHYLPFSKRRQSKSLKYRLSDEFLAFSFKYIQPNRRLIDSSPSLKLFELVTRSGWESWLGYAFERFCVKNNHVIINALGIRDEVLFAGPEFIRHAQGFQIDLLFERADKVVSLCEVKYSNKPIGTEVIPQIERKLRMLHVPRGFSVEKVLISLYGPDDSLRATEYFHQYITLPQLLA